MRIRAIDILPFNWHGIYAHGLLQEKLMDDRISSDKDLATVPDGIVNPRDKAGETLIGYFWTTEGGHRRGLIVYPHDSKAIQYARARFEAKSLSL